MIAAERGRDENIKVLLNLDSMSEEAMDEESVRDPGTQRVTLNAKDKYTMAAIHFAAKHGHSVSLQLRLGFTTRWPRIRTIHME